MYTIRNKMQKRAAVAPMVAVSALIVVGMAALAVDVALVSTGRAELQSSADAAALAGTMALLDEARLTGTEGAEQVISNARHVVVDFASRNPVLNVNPVVEANTGNTLDGDVLVGRLEDATDRTSPMTFTDPANFNAVRVRVRRDNERNGPISLLFAKIFGTSTMEARAAATAIVEDGIVGFRVEDGDRNAQLLPFALHIDEWSKLEANRLAGAGSDAFSCEDGVVAQGSDGLPELNLYPGAGNGQLPPGNFGTVDLGASNNSTADISRQILHGVNEYDLAAFGGEFVLGPDGTLSVNGDTGLSAAVKDELEAIKGQPRVIPLFNEVKGPGNNAYFTVVGFAGIRIMDVKLTGPMKNKKLVIQAAQVVDPTAIAGGHDNSYYVYRPVTLCR